MATVTLRGKPIHTIGELPPLGSRASDFRLTRVDLSDVTLADFTGKKKILNIVPSLDTHVCATSAKKFNERATQVENTVILTISRDLPFAQKRFCEAEKIEGVITLSDLRDRSFGKSYGVEMVDGPLAGLLARAIVVLDTSDRVVYTQLVPEIAMEPDYEQALKAVQTLP